MSFVTREPAHREGRDTTPGLCSLWIDINGRYEDARDLDPFRGSMSAIFSVLARGHWDSLGHSGKEVTMVVEQHGCTLLQLPAVGQLVGEAITEDVQPSPD